jgi:flagellar biosynthesis/type III secretory pathway protein FliH
MSLRFRPPPLAGFYSAPDVDNTDALTEARQEGFAEGRTHGMREGHAAGLAEGVEKTRAALQPELDALRETSAKRDRRVGVADALRQVLAARDVDLAVLENAFREAAVAALQKLFPTLLASAAGTEIAALLADALTERTSETLMLRAHPETLATVAAETATERESGRVTVTVIPSMPFGAAEIAWIGGGITFDPVALLARVTSVLAAPASATPFPVTLIPEGTP